MFISDLLIRLSAFSTPLFSMIFSDSRIPAVSYRVIGTPCNTKSEDKISLVVPGRLLVIA